MIVDDEADIRRFLVRTLQSFPVECVEAENGREALEHFRELNPEIVFLDVRLPDMDGLEVLRKIKSISYDVHVILITAFDDSHIAVEAMKLGAYEYITKPVDLEHLEEILERILEKMKVPRDEDEVSDISFYGMLGKTPVMKRLFSFIRKVAATEAPVLIYGESGTGKRLAAEIIHRLSPRQEGPFVVVDCGTLPTHLIESELFGYEKGAFTGADHQKRGRLEQANRGTIFLDEISNLHPEGQMKLLRFLDERVIQRLGSTQPITLDVRVIAATNRPLEKLVEEGKFRDDLYYRLNVFEIEIPPLRERLDDIPLLVHSFIRQFSEQYKKTITGVQPEVMSIFLRHTWPGNVRELRNVVERCVALADSWITLVHLPRTLKKHFEDEFGILDQLPFHERARKILEKTEEHLILEALQRTGGNRKKAAKLLGISLRTLYIKLKKYRLYNISDNDEKQEL